MPYCIRLVVPLGCFISCIYLAKRKKKREISSEFFLMCLRDHSLFELVSLLGMQWKKILTIDQIWHEAFCEQM